MERTIKVYDRDPAAPWNSAEVPRVAVGSFDPRLAQYWQGNGQRRVPVLGGGNVLVSRDGERLWRTDGGRWVLTDGGSVCYYVTDGEADAWLVECGYETAEDRASFARQLAS